MVVSAGKASPIDIYYGDEKILFGGRGSEA
jgi:hypothetical protein